MLANKQQETTHTITTTMHLIQWGMFWLSGRVAGHEFSSLVLWSVYVDWEKVARSK